MIKCPNCGNEATDDAVFCDQCGTRLKPAADSEAPAAPSLSEAPEAAPTAAPAPQPSPQAAPQAAPPPPAPEPAGRCPDCGALNTPGELYCSECGAPLEAPQPEAQANIPAEAEAPAPVAGAAGAAGAATGDACAFCGAPLGPDDEFCYACGAQRGQPAPEAAAAAPAARAPQPATAEREVPADDEVITLPPPPPAAPAEAAEAQPAAPSEEAPPAETAAEVSPEPEAPPEPEALVEPEAPTVAEAQPAEPQPLTECPTCGAEVTPGDAFCQFCGAALVGATGPAAAAPQAPPQPTPQPAPQAQPQPAPAAAAQAPRLVIATSGIEIPLPTGQQVVVGREDPYTGVYPDVDLSPHGGEEGGVSRRHFRIAQSGGRYTVEDLNSTNMTYVNRQQLQPGAPVALSDGDEIRAGRVRMTFRAS